MVHPIFSVLISKPELVMEHVAGYAALLRDEASSAGVQVARRAIAWAVTLISLLLFLILAGVAVMLGAVNDRFHWALLLVPALALGSGLAAVLAGVVAWGFAQGVQDSTVKAVVADLVAAVASFDRHFEIAIGKPRHDFGHPLQRAAQRLDQHQAADDGEKRAGHHGDDRHVGGALAVLFARFLGAADEIFERLAGAGHQFECRGFAGLPARADVDQLCRARIDIV